jgi:hypothetical protein
LNREPLDSILSGGGEAASGQDLSNTDTAHAPASESSQAVPGEAAVAIDAGPAEAAEAAAMRMVPHQALHAERQKSRRYGEEVANFRQALAETNARMAQLAEAVTPRQAAPEPPDFFDNPEAATRHEVVQTVSPELSRINQTLHAFARENAFQRFSESKVNDAERAFLTSLQAGTLDPADYRRVVNSPNRYAEAVKWHQRQTARDEIGDDPEAFKARVEAELREKIMAEFGGTAGRFAAVTPTNLAGVRNVGSRSGPAWSGPASLNDIFDRRK